MRQLEFPMVRGQENNDRSFRGNWGVCLPPLGCFINKTFASEIKRTEKTGTLPPAYLRIPVRKRGTGLPAGGLTGIGVSRVPT